MSRYAQHELQQSANREKLAVGVQPRPHPGLELRTNVSNPAQAKLDKAHREMQRQGMHRTSIASQSRRDPESLAERDRLIQANQKEYQKIQTKQDLVNRAGENHRVKYQRADVMRYTHQYNVNRLKKLKEEEIEHRENEKQRLGNLARRQTYAGQQLTSSLAANTEGYAALRTERRPLKHNRAAAQDTMSGMSQQQAKASRNRRLTIQEYKAADEHREKAEQFRIDIPRMTRLNQQLKQPIGAAVSESFQAIKRLENARDDLASQTVKSIPVLKHNHKELVRERKDPHRLSRFLESRSTGFSRVAADRAQASISGPPQAVYRERRGR